MGEIDGALCRRTTAEQLERPRHSTKSRARRYFAPIVPCAAFDVIAPNGFAVGSTQNAW